MCVDTKTRPLKQKLLGEKILGYKVTKRNGRPPIFMKGCSYGPGISLATQNDGTIVDPSFGRNEYILLRNGIHVFRTLKDAKNWRGFGEKIIKVVYSEEDIIAYDDEEVALRKIEITEKQWKAANMPHRVVRKRKV